MKDWNYFSAYNWNKINLDNISEEWFHNLEDIIAFCDERDIALTLISAPMSNYLLSGVENYDEYIALIRGIIEDTNVNYYDFNLCKEEYFPNTSALFKDVDHMNCYGAEAFSYLLAAFINGEISENELFYDSYMEKLEQMEPTVFGISYYDSENTEGLQARNCKIVSNRINNLEFEIILAPMGKELYKIQDFSDNSFFTIASDEHGVIMITYREVDSPDKTCKINITY